jgi:hypothetical protein
MEPFEQDAALQATVGKHAKRGREGEQDDIAETGMFADRNIPNERNRVFKDVAIYNNLQRNASLADAQTLAQFHNMQNEHVAARYNDIRSRVAQEDERVAATNAYYERMALPYRTTWSYLGSNARQSARYKHANWDLEKQLAGIGRGDE